MRRGITLALVALIGLMPANATVFINEVFINPPGSLDDTREFIELLGTPGKKLDGYAVALVNGAMTKYYPLGSIPPRPLAQEIDEFFSLDGLELGPNGLLVLGISISSNYPTLLSDTSFRRWNNVWNGGLDTPGKLENDGSNTIMLIRNRPGRTQADPTNPLGLLWGKDIAHDDELITPVIDPQTQQQVDQYGDGNLDKGQPNGMGGYTLDMKGASTPDDITDDLEVVDEVSYEHERGWEYDVDERHVDIGSAYPGLPYRHVHALDDPQGFNPDVLTRVDYRTKGDGWLPAPGAIGEMPNGNNWQDTAMEQWLRGESLVGSGGAGSAPQFFYSNADNTNPDAIQPYVTNVPRWLDDGVEPDYDFSAPYTYQIMAGRLNPLAIPFIPGDADRDGDCDADDIARIAAVFGDDDWIFSNSFADAPEGDGGDPATQIRPWDVDATGDNGIEPSDLQWTLNFQGSTTGQIVGVRYASTTPASTGVVLNDNAGTTCTITTAVAVPSGRALDELSVHDEVEITVRAELTAGANLTPGAENGVMQFVHDILLDGGWVAQVVSVEALGEFNKTRPEIELPRGVLGDEGLDNINGYCTDFTQGLDGPADLYRVVIRAVGLGTTTVALYPATAPNFSASTPHGLKIGHTRSNGDPAFSYYPAPITLTVVGGPVPGDCDGNGDVDADDWPPVAACLTGPQVPPAGDCVCADLDGDGDADLADFAAFQLLFGE